MKKGVIKYLFLFVCLISLSINCIAQGTGFVRLDGKQFKDESGNNFFPMIMNYIPGMVCDNTHTTFKVIRNRQMGTTECVLEPTGRYYDLAHCEQSLDDDFEKLKLMGFNTIRFLWAPNRNDTANQPGGFHKTADVWSTSDMCNSGTYTFNFVPANYNCTNCDAQIFFNLIAHALDIAQTHGIKVIFLCADHSGDTYPEMGSSQADADDYAAYLSALATVLKNKPALLAYDIYNEPNYDINNSAKNMHIPKQTVCSYVGEWYDAIKTADPNHLVTIGGTDIGDVYDWDPGIMKIDFVSMHPYPTIPDPNNSAETVSTRTEKMLNMISWFSSAFPIPWIIGETGLSASDISCLQPYLWGNDTDQKNYIAAILPAIRDCGGSGFSWWDFQEKHWYCIPGEVCNPTCNYCNNWGPGGPGPGGSYCGHTNPGDTLPLVAAKDLQDAENAINGNYSGLLKYGDPDSTGLYDASVVDKPAIAITSSFNPNASASCVAPTTYYYNPHQYTSSSGTVSGTIKDQNTTPIKDAVIFSHTTIHTNAGDVSRLEYTFTNQSGVFNLIPAPTPPFQSSTDILDLDIAACGAERKTFGSPSYPPFPSTFSLKKTLIDYNTTVSATISSGTQNYSAWNSITASSFFVQSGASSDLTAREEVNANAEFHAAQGSEVHLYTSDVFPDCPDYSTYAYRLNNNNNNNNSQTNGSAESEPVKEIEVDFTKPLKENFLSVIPNPSSGKFLVQLNSSDANSFVQNLCIYDVLGKQVYSLKENIKTANIDLSSFPKGIYYLKANDTVKSYYKKIIIE